MAATDSIIYSLERNWEMVEAAIVDLDEEVLASQPTEHSNSMAWIFGHMNRVTDMFVMHRLQSKAQLWISDGWCEKYGMNENVEGLGMGQSVEKITAWTPPSLEVQLGYFSAVKAITKNYLPYLTSEDLETPVVFPPQALRQEHTLATALGQLVLENVAHGGQIAYIRGFHKGIGWYR